MIQKFGGGKFRILHVFLCSVFFLILFTCRSYNFSVNSLFHSNLYLLLSIGIVYSFLAIFSPKSILNYVLYFYVLFLPGIYLFEIYLQIYTPSRVFFYDDNATQRQEIANRSGVQFDNRTKAQVVQELLTMGTEATTFISPANFIRSNGIKLDNTHIFPLSGISNITTVSCNESGFYNIYKSDEFGFNNFEHIHEQASVDVVLLGDAVVLGTAIHPENNIKSKFEEFTHMKAINLASSDGPLIQLAVYREYGMHFKSKYIIWFYNENNDLFDLAEELKSPLLNQYLEDQNFTQNLRRHDELKNIALKNYFSTTYFPALKSEKYSEKNKETLVPKGVKSALFLRYLRLFIGLKKPTSLPFESFEKILETMKTSAANADSELVFVYLPSYSRFKNTQNDHYQYRSEILKMTDKLGIKTLDVYKQIDNPERYLEFYPFGVDGHLNKKGAEWVSSLLASFIEDN